MRARAYGAASLLLLLSSFILRCTCLKLISSSSFQIVKIGGNITILCQAEFALSSCQVMEFETNKFYELSHGPHKHRSHNWRYHGKGLDHGQCGLHIKATENVAFYKIFVVRARSGGANWSYATAAVESTLVESMIFPVECGPEKIYVDPGSNVVFKYEAADEISFCNFRWQGQNEWMTHGAGLEYTIDKTNMTVGVCKLTLHEVIDKSSGFVMAHIGGKNDFNEKVPVKICVTTMIVKDPPDKPQLKLQDCIGGTELMCTAGPGRPAPTITWQRGDVVIRADEENEADSGRWVWEYEPRSVTQNLNKRLTQDNDGEDITCTVWHIAFNQNGTKHTKLPMPLATTLSNMFLFIVYLLIGIGTVMLAIAITVFILIIYKYVKRTWCFIDMPK